MDKKLLLAIIGLLLSLSLQAKDPTRPILPDMPSNTSKAISNEKIEQPLTAIFTKKKKRIAIIEEKTYQVGDYYNDNQIISIEQDKVWLKSDQGDFQLTLIPNIKK